MHKLIGNPQQGSHEEHVGCDEGQSSLNVAILEVGAPKGRVNT